MKRYPGDQETEQFPALTYQGPEDKGLEAPYIDPIQSLATLATGGVGALVPKPQDMVYSAAREGGKLISGSDYIKKIKEMTEARTKARERFKPAKPVEDLGKYFSPEAIRAQQQKNRAADLGLPLPTSKSSPEADKLAQGLNIDRSLVDQATLNALKRLRGD